MSFLYKLFTVVTKREYIFKPVLFLKKTEEWKKFKPYLFVIKININESWGQRKPVATDKIGVGMWKSRVGPQSLQFSF